MRRGNPSTQTLDSMRSPRSRENSSSEPLCSQWEILMRKFSEDCRVRNHCRSLPEELPLEERSLCFPTGSTYEGTWTALGMHGYGLYTYPNGVEYEGEFEEGQFHGEGELRYPSGAVVRGRWRRGVVQARSLEFAPPGDCGEYLEGGWEYCRGADRRFASEREAGARGARGEGVAAAGRTQLTAEQPARALPAGLYDTGTDLYDPRTRVCYRYDDVTDMTRCLPERLQVWAVERCRRAPDAPVGPRPELYQRWWSCEGPEGADDDERSGRFSVASTSGRESVFSTAGWQWARTSLSPAGAGTAGPGPGWARRVIQFTPGDT